MIVLLNRFFFVVPCNVKCWNTHFHYGEKIQKMLQNIFWKRIFSNARSKIFCSSTFSYPSSILHIEPVVVNFVARCFSKRFLSVIISSLQWLCDCQFEWLIMRLWSNILWVDSWVRPKDCACFSTEHPELIFKPLCTCLTFWGRRALLG